jgi:hypothetical protein
MRPFFIAALFLATLSNAGFAQNAPEPGVKVTLSRQNSLHLHVTLTSGAATTVQINRFELPWGFRYSMVFAAARPDEETVELLLPVADPVLSAIKPPPHYTSQAGREA